MNERNAPEIPSIWYRLREFLRKPWRQKKQSLGFRYLRRVPHAFVPIRLPIGAWWLAENDFIGTALLWSGFEDAARALVERMVVPGMTVLDIGAHKGFYSLLMSRSVGNQGRVLAFEPSRRERFRLKVHLGINVCRNVTVFDFALGQAESESLLFVVDGMETGFNSLRPPAEDVATHTEAVRVRRLDAVLEEQGMNHVDFIKIDVEGGEFAVFLGAEQLLRRVPRPVVMAEVSDRRTRQWGHKGEDLLALFEGLGFQWFAISPDGRLLPLDKKKATHDDNFVAVPEERNQEIERLLARPDHIRAIALE